MPFEKGNKYGGRKPRGSTHKRTLMLAGLRACKMKEPEFAMKVVKMALAGDSTALRVVSDRLWQLPKPTMPGFVAPEGNTKQENAEYVIEAMMSGQIAPDQASTAMSVLRGGAEIIEVAELLAIVKKLEGK
jgi:hypothetical protein